MANILSAAPVLSTPDSHILSEIEPPSAPEPSKQLSDEQFSVRYEIERTVKEIKQHQWDRVALQFPDHMLSDSARVYQLLARGLRSKPDHHVATAADAHVRSSVDVLQGSETEVALTGPVKLTILGDTSYGSCCVDEIGAEHVDADAVIHYGRSCLSPTARLPVVYVFTTRELDLDAACEAFKETFPHRDSRVIITADTPYANHVEGIGAQLADSGYTNLFNASIIHNPSSLVPNRTVPPSIAENPSRLRDWDLFHISDPPTSLLLTLSSRMKSVHIYRTATDGDTASTSHQANSSMILRRRYALITSLSTVSTWGILINTLSVKNYLHIVDHVRSLIHTAGKKSYLFVVGKLNPAKVANFAEIGGWVVIGCWESSLVDSKDFYKPLVTPFELDLVLAGDKNRVWTGEWRADFQGILDQAQQDQSEDGQQHGPQVPGGFPQDNEAEEDEEVHDFDSEEESEPPEFDLRTGRYVSHSKPMSSRRQEPRGLSYGQGDASSHAVVKRSKGELLAINGVASPAAEFLAQSRTWQGLGSDFEIKYDDEDEGALVEEGRTGVAKGYTVGDSTRS